VKLYDTDCCADRCKAGAQACQFGPPGLSLLLIKLHAPLCLSGPAQVLPVDVLVLDSPAHCTHPKRVGTWEGATYTQAALDQYSTDNHILKVTHTLWSYPSAEVHVIIKMLLLCAGARCSAFTVLAMAKTCTPQRAAGPGEPAAPCWCVPYV